MALRNRSVSRFDLGTTVCCKVGKSTSEHEDIFSGKELSYMRYSLGLEVLATRRYTIVPYSLLKTPLKHTPLKHYRYPQPGQL